MSNPLMIIKLSALSAPLIVNDKAEVSTLLENFTNLKTQLNSGSDYFAERPLTVFKCLWKLYTSNTIVQLYLTHGKL